MYCACDVTTLFGIFLMVGTCLCITEGRSSSVNELVFWDYQPFTSGEPGLCTTVSEPSCVVRTIHDAHDFPPSTHDFVLVLSWTLSCPSPPPGSSSCACSWLCSFHPLWVRSSVIHHGVLDLKRPRGQSSVHVRASGLLSPASSSLVVFASRVLTPPSARCACRERCLLVILQRVTLLSRVLLAVIMALHEPPIMAPHGSPASLHAIPCFRQAVCSSTG